MVSMSTIGTTIMIDMYDCADNHLDSQEEITKLLEAAADAAGATVLNLHVHKFEPHGFTGVAVISESHIAVHTWPEFKFSSVDIYTCGDRAMPEKAKDFLLKILRPKKHHVSEVVRGGVCWETPDD